MELKDHVILRVKSNNTWLSGIVTKKADNDIYCVTDYNLHRSYYIQGNDVAIVKRKSLKRHHFGHVVLDMTQQDKMPKLASSVYLFRTDGKVEPFELNKTKTSEVVGSDLDKSYKLLYVVSLDDTHALFMDHDSNEDMETREKSALPLNEALRFYIPDANYRGNLLLCATEQENSNEISQAPFNYHEYLRHCTFSIDDLGEVVRVY